MGLTGKAFTVFLITVQDMELAILRLLTREPRIVRCCTTCKCSPRSNSRQCFLLLRLDFAACSHDHSAGISCPVGSQFKLLLWALIEMSHRPFFFSALGPAGAFVQNLPIGDLTIPAFR